MHTEIIAELGINHNGDLDLCRQMIDGLASIGVDAVKFQIVSKELNYNLPEDSHLLPFFRQSDLGLSGYKIMASYCRKKGVKPYSSIADVYGVEVFQKANFDLVKLSSSNLTNRPLHKKILNLKKPVIFSTGSGTLEEIVNTSNYFASNQINYSVLHCIAQYPAPFDELNISVIPFLMKVLNTKIGFSDHSEGAMAGAMAVQHGATILEKHFTLDHNLEGPDHKFSLTLPEMKSYVESVRVAEKSIGNAHNYFEQNANHNEVIKRTLVVNKDYKAGEVIRECDLFVARPNKVENDYIHPFSYENLIGKSLNKDVKKWDAITWDNI